MNVVKNPTMKPVHISERVCRRSSMRAVPRAPAIIISVESHHIALKPNMNENATTPPVIPPIAAICVETFSQLLSMAQTICTKSAATMIDDMKCGKCSHFIVW